jgi:phage FluMu gp28-like protein
MTSYFLPYQDKWINDDSLIKAAEKSRRVGFTYASSYRMHQKCMRKKPPFTQWVSSRDQFTAQELIAEYISFWCKASNITAKGMYGDKVEVFDVAKDIKAFICTYPNGNRIVSLASTPEVFAGKGGDVFLDEVDLHKDPGRLIDMAMPCTTWGGQLEMVSAYKVDGSKNTPWALMIADAKRDNPQSISLHCVTIHDAVGQGLVEKINEVTGKNMTRDEFVDNLRARCRNIAAWQSQYECLVSDGGGKLLPMSAITPCEMPADEIADILLRNPKAPRFGGYDVARRYHGSAWHAYAMIGVTLFRAESEVFHGRKFRDQEAWLNARLTDVNKPRIARMGIDSTGLGMHMAENLSDDFPGRVDAVNLESHRRNELCLLLADRIEAKQFKMPPDNQTRADFNGPFKSSAKNGALRIVLPAFSGEDGELSHCDEFIAAVLANSAADAGDVFDFAPMAFNNRRSRSNRSRRLAASHRRDRRIA